ncbi:BadF/BadG/BcrA/BcrD ATPase family protein [Pedococcus sp. 5OH_020]|uniref:BadF/BadG/BcrA/BcrD ATPase family protein n=1 Tax=Pedococcus sp. 5OH_020 TaxID=2989814 RepID=UPI0022E9EE8D|nr:BadF/BadG/BcrA/BcrD ATPase family protein [Pedococcus sp. 5OH_020]
MSVLLAVDGGQGATRMRLVVDGAAVHEWRVAPGRPGDQPDAVLVAMSEDVATALQQGGLPAPMVLSAGMTGFHGAVTGADRVLASYGALGVVRVVLATDAVTSLLGAVGVVPGAVVAAGTGTIVLASDGKGRCERVDGWGSTLGDDGSGYAVARAGLRAAFRSLDGRSGSEALRAAAERRYGSLNLLPARVAGASDAVPLVAQFAEDVAQLALEADPTAADIWDRAGEDLADSVAAAAVRVFGGISAARGSAISWAGALFRAGDLLVQPFQRGLARHGLPPAQPPVADGLAGAVALARSGVPELFPALAQSAATIPDPAPRSTNRSTMRSSS